MKLMRLLEELSSSRRMLAALRRAAALAHHGVGSFTPEMGNARAHTLATKAMLETELELELEDELAA
jgi:hypothetical protein